VNAPAAERRATPEWKLRLIVAAGLFASWLIGLTWRYRTRNAEGWERLRDEGKPWVFVLWHGTLLSLTYFHRHRDIATLISEHRDGEIIARMVQAWGYRPIRGSTSRGAGRALLAMIRELERGSVLAITPDGPRGPARTFQPGALVAAQRAGVPVVPITLHADRAWRFNSWDGFTIPKPFARVTVGYGTPTMVQGDTPREAAADAARFEALMLEAQAIADA
jgi:lysophospholipid acyltransferase (LPLAT)-like uncharacterized protein